MNFDQIVAERLLPISEVVDVDTGRPLTVAARAAPEAPWTSSGVRRQQRRATEREAAKGRRAA